MSIRAMAVGSTFEGRVREMSLDRILAFSGGFLSDPGWPHKNLHTDLAKAQDAGLPDLIASGNQSVGILVELLTEIFGSTWFTQGVLDLKIVNSVYSGDTVQAKAVVKERRERGGTLDVVLDAWCENQNGVKVITGDAVCRLDAPSA
jgi:acyl dehydratase